MVETAQPGRLGGVAQHRRISPHQHRSGSPRVKVQTLGTSSQVHGQHSRLPKQALMPQSAACQTRMRSQRPEVILRKPQPGMGQSLGSHKAGHLAQPQHRITMRRGGTPLASLRWADSNAATYIPVGAHLYSSAPELALLHPKLQRQGKDIAGSTLGGMTVCTAALLHA